MNSSLHHPVLYEGQCFPSRGHFTRHHFHFRGEEGVVIEYEFSRDEWSSMYIRFDCPTIKLLVPAFGKNTQGFQTGLVSTDASRVWLMVNADAQSRWSELEIATYLYKAIRWV